MSGAHHVWKIRDKNTGLFWCGYRAVECCDKIGTRFVMRSNLDGTITKIIQQRGHFPDHWEVVYVELVEVITSSRSAAWIMIDSAISKPWEKLAQQRNISPSDATFILQHIRDLRRKDQLFEFVSIGRRSNHKLSSWVEFAKRMEALGVAKTQMLRLTGGWIVFKDEVSAIAARLNDEMSSLYDIDNMLTEIADLLGVEKDAI